MSLLVPSVVLVRYLSQKLEWGMEWLVEKARGKHNLFFKVNCEEENKMRVMWLEE